MGGACVGEQAVIFYPESEWEDDSVEYVWDISVADYFYCRICPVRLACLSTALATKEEWGIWGGVGRRERRSWLRRSAERGLRLTCAECLLQLDPDTIRAKSPLCGGCSPLPLEETA